MRDAPVVKPRRTESGTSIRSTRTAAPGLEMVVRLYAPVDAGVCPAGLFRLLIVRYTSHRRSPQSLCIH